MLATPTWRKRPLAAKAWYRIPEEYQLELADQSLRRAVMLIAEQADSLASAMEAGDLKDRGGPDALRVLGHLMRMAGREHLPPAGHA